MFRAIVYIKRVSVFNVSKCFNCRHAILLHFARAVEKKHLLKRNVLLAWLRVATIHALISFSVRAKKPFGTFNAHVEKLSTVKEMKPSPYVFRTCFRVVRFG